MKSISLKEAGLEYMTAQDRLHAADEPIVVEADGTPVAVLISLEDYVAFQQWQAARGQREPFLPPDFAREVAAFERLRPALLAEYAGRVVAIRDEKVVVVGDDPAAVLSDVERRLGPGMCYVEWVEADSPRRVRVPSLWTGR